MAVDPSSVPPSVDHLPAISRRRVFALGGGALAGVLVGAGTPGVAAHAAPSSGPGLAKAFEKAAAEHGVPRDLLVAIGYAETRLDNHGGSPSQADGFGIMHLVSNPAHRTLEVASRLTGTSPAVLRAEDAANIDGAAAVLRAYADDVRLAGISRRDLAAWYPVVARYSGAADPFVARMYADGVYDALAGGAEADGVTLDAKPVQPDRAGYTTSADDGDVSILSADYPPALWVPAHSSNYTVANRPSSNPINYVIVHVTQGSYAGTISWFQNPASNVSAHYVIRSSDGQVTQMLRNKDIGWHAGNWTYNQQSIGLEHEGFVDNPAWFTDAMYRSSAALTAHVCNVYGIPKTRSRIIGHNEVPGATHTDPGPHWNWSTYMSYVTGGGDPTWQTTIDNSSANFTASGNWGTSTWSSQRYGADYRFTTPEPVSDAAWYRANLPSSGTYRVEAWYPSNSGYNDRAPYVVVTTSGNQSVHVNQRSGGGAWRSIGTFSMAAGERNVVGVSRWTNGTGYVIADAVRISRL